MSRAESLRQIVIGSGSTLENHSLNQHKLKLAVQLSERAYRSRRLTEQKLADIEAADESARHEANKIDRIMHRVAMTLAGYDGSDPLVFGAEVRYLRSQGVIK